MSETFPPLTDFNDLAEAEGLEAVQEQLAAAIEDAQQEQQAAPAVEWPAPILPGTRAVPDVPATVLPGWLGDMAGAVSESTQTPPALSPSPRPTKLSRAVALALQLLMLC